MYNHVDFTQQSPVILSFCPGIRGIERGLERIFRAVRTCAYVEIEAFIVENLLAAMEEGLVDAAPIWTNLKTFNPKPFRGKVDGIIGGYPCQPFSLAGKREGENDPRHLWPFIREHVRTIQPGWCFFENVSGHLTLGFDVVKAELEEMGYFVEAGIYTAEEVGAPHRRERLFILAIRVGDTGHDSTVRHDTRTGGEIRMGVEGDILLHIGRSKEEYLSDTSSTRVADDTLEHSQSRRDGGISDTVSQREGCRLTGGGADDRRANELANTDNNGLDGTKNGKSLVERGNGDETRQNEFQQSERRSSDRTDEELADGQYEGLQRRLHGRQNTEREGVDRHFGCSSTSIFRGWPAGQGTFQYDYEEPRTIESSLEYTINGYNFTEDLHRAIGNSVVEQTAELAFRDLWRKVSDWYRFVNG